MNLPNMTKSFDVIWAIVDHMTKSTQFLSIRETSSTGKLVEIYVRDVVASKGVPTLIFSYRDVHFTSRF